VNQEIAIKRNLIGRCYSSCKKNCIKSCTGTPNAKLLQKKMILLQTNYQSKKLLDIQLIALEKSLNYFKIK
jgi:hypothetical protein